MLQRFSFSLHLVERACIAVLCAGVTGGPASTCCAQQEAATLDLTSHSWQVGADTVHGFAGTGKVFHQSAGEPEKLIRFVLMPAGWAGDDGAFQDPGLYFGTKQLYIGDATMQLIDLRHGAAYVELGELEGEMEDLVLHEVRRVAYSQYLVLRREEAGEGDEQPQRDGEAPLGDQRENLLPLTPRELHRSLPRELGRFNARILAFADDWRLAGRLTGENAPDSRTLFSTMPDEVATELFWIYWPMIITHRTIAGAEGTKVVVSSLAAPGNAGDADYLAFVKLIEIEPTHNAAVTLPDGNVIPLALDDELRFDIQTGQTPVEQVPTDAHRALISKLQNMMEPGFTSAFPGN